MYRNVFGHFFTARQVLLASLFQMDLNNAMAARAFAGLSREPPKGRQAVARSRYIPAGEARNTPAAINSRKVRRAGGLG